MQPHWQTHCPENPIVKYRNLFKTITHFTAWHKHNEFHKAYPSGKVKKGLKNLKKPWSWFHIELQVGAHAVIAHRLSCTRNTRASSDILVQAHYQTSQIVPSQQLLTGSLECNQVLGPFFSSATSNMYNKTVYESGRQISLHYSKKITSMA